jgi:apolipoprotein N-acyltransferase
LAPLQRFADRLRALRGWRRLGLSILVGALGALGFPPFYLFPLLVAGYPVLLLLLDGAAEEPRPLRRAAAIGWGYGFGLFFVGLHWIGYAFLVNAEAHAWQMPFAIVLFPAGLAFFFAFAAMLYVALRRAGPQRVYWFTFSFALTEWLRGNILTGFPWNIPGYGWGISSALLQTTSLIGVYGLSLLTLLLGASLVLLLPRERVRTLPLAMVVLFLIFWSSGAARLSGADDATVPNVQLRIVQPATSQREKYDPALRAQNWQRLVDLSTAPADVAPTHIIWPEAAVPVFGLIGESDGQQRIDLEGQEIISGVSAQGRVLLTGAVKITQDATARAYFNSFYMFRDGTLLAGSDKFHLVPFGEYLPLERTLQSWGLTQIAGGVSGFSEGPGPQTFAVPGAPPVTPLICYEVVFPHAVTGTPRPGWLINLTDDTWFGPNAGPLQHLLIVRVRAIEEGLPIARAANAGISVIVDSYGRIRNRLELGERGMLDGPLPVALPPTLYARFGEIIFFVLVFLTLGAAFLPHRVNRA